MSFANPVPGVLHPLGWQRPAGSAEFVVTRDCAGHRATKQGCALDIGNGRCDGKVLAVAAGRVIYIDPTQGIVRIDHGGGWRSDYAHMLPIMVKVGQTVSVGQQIGEVGDAHDPAIRNFAGCHLHFAIVHNGVEVDAWPLLAQNTTEDDMAWLDGLKVGTINGVPTPCRISVSQGSPYYLEPGGKAYPLPYDFSVTCVGLVGDQGLYLLNAGGFRLVDLTDIVEAEPLGTDPTERTRLQRIATAVDGVLQGARTIKRIAEE